MKYNLNCKDGAPVILEGAEIPPVFKAMRVTCGPGKLEPGDTVRITLDEAWTAVGNMHQELLTGSGMPLRELADTLGALIIRGEHPTEADLEQDIIDAKDILIDPENRPSIDPALANRRLGIALMSKMDAASRAEYTPVIPPVAADVLVGTPAPAGVAGLPSVL